MKIVFQIIAMLFFISGIVSLVWFKIGAAEFIPDTVTQKQATIPYEFSSNAILNYNIDMPSDSPLTVIDTTGQSLKELKLQQLMYSTKSMQIDLKDAAYFKNRMTDFSKMTQEAIDTKSVIEQFVDSLNSSYNHSPELDK